MTASAIVFDLHVLPFFFRDRAEVGGCSALSIATISLLLHGVGLKNPCCSADKCLFLASVGDQGLQRNRHDGARFLRYCYAPRTCGAKIYRPRRVTACAVYCLFGTDGRRARCC